MQRLNGKIILSGTGLHSGVGCEVTIEPYDAQYVIMRSGDEEYPLHMLKSDGSKRGSDYIFPSGTVIRTCEHVLSALAGLGIYSGVRITIDGGEMPGLDGCAEEVCTQIKSHSYEDGEGERGINICHAVIVSNEDRTRFVAAFPADVLHITYTVEYDTVGVQIYDYAHTPGKYITDIAPARTFAYEREIEYLRSRGMALGGSLDNAIVIGDTVHAKGGLRWCNEFVRHKVLDLIGDLSSIGRAINGHIIAVRAGHELHLRLAERLKGEIASGRN